VAKLGGPVDRDEWFMTPQTVKAYYNPGMNEIVFPAAILQPPFFDAEADDAANYGGIGAVIGHAIGHGFADQGSKYDGDGHLFDWWTAEDRAEFSVRTTQLIEQYDAFVPRELEIRDNPPHVQGAFTVGENIGDLGGLSIALLAYQLSLGGREAPVIDGLTGVQRVLFGWAQVWRTKSRAAESIRRLATDPHSPPEFRCNGVVRNVDAYYDAFGVSDDDALYPTRSSGFASGASASGRPHSPSVTPAQPSSPGGTPEQRSAVLDQCGAGSVRCWISAAPNQYRVHCQSSAPSGLLYRPTEFFTMTGSPLPKLS